jgi:hypothetical protein
MSSVLTNTGDRALRVTGVALAGHSGDFAVLSDTCQGAPLAPAASCQIQLRFTPTAAGPRSATLTVTDDSTAAGATTAALSGTGQAPEPAAGDPTATGTPPAAAAGGATRSRKATA